MPIEVRKDIEQLKADISTAIIDAIQHWVNDYVGSLCGVGISIDDNGKLWVDGWMEDSLTRVRSELLDEVFDGVGFDLNAGFECDKHRARCERAVVYLKAMTIEAERRLLLMTEQYERRASPVSE
jgi:hypothetical protein